MVEFCTYKFNNNFKRETIMALIKYKLYSDTTHQLFPASSSTALWEQLQSTALPDDFLLEYDGKKITLDDLKTKSFETLVTDPKKTLSLTWHNRPMTVKEEKTDSLASSDTSKTETAASSTASEKTKAADHDDQEVVQTILGLLEQLPKSIDEYQSSIVYQQLLMELLLNLPAWITNLYGALAVGGGGFNQPLMTPADIACLKEVVNNPNAKVLDVGCGSGVFSLIVLYLSSKPPTIMGIDKSQENLDSVKDTIAKRMPEKKDFFMARKIDLTDPEDLKQTLKDEKGNEIRFTHVVERNVAHFPTGE